MPELIARGIANRTILRQKRNAIQQPVLQMTLISFKFALIRRKLITNRASMNVGMSGMMILNAKLKFHLDVFGLPDKIGEKKPNNQKVKSGFNEKVTER
jgi:hypothetical protein